MNDAFREWYEKRAAELARDLQEAESGEAAEAVWRELEPIEQALKRLGSEDESV